MYHKMYLTKVLNLKILVKIFSLLPFGGKKKSNCLKLRQRQSAIFFSTYTVDTPTVEIRTSLPLQLLM